ncbi:hypothetical protein GCM10027452_44520 [Micromonospora halotolerans]
MLGEGQLRPARSTGAFLEPGIRVDASAPRVGSRVVVDPRTGRVLDQVELSGPEADPDAPLVVHEEPGGLARSREVTHGVWRERSLLMPGDAPVTRMANAPDAAEFLLTVRCSGPGTVVVGLTGSADDETERVLSCEEPNAVSFSVVGARGGPLLVRFVALHDRVDLDAQLDTLG